MLIYKNKKSSGFTIVELLIVIVVIGILASITIVAYSGVQARAKMAKKESEIGLIKQKMQLYYSIHNSFPTIDDTLPANAELGSLTNNMVFSDDFYNCYVQELTKDKYCVAAFNFGPKDHYRIFWWDDIKKLWQYTSIYAGDGYVETGVVDNGSGSLPDGEAT